MWIIAIMNTLLSLSQALHFIEQQLPNVDTLATECINITQAQNRICAEDILSPINVPAFDNSAMDGYAVRLADLNDTDCLPLVGKSFAGNPFQGEWQAHSTIRIMTGAMLPPGTDAVVMQEDTEQNPDGTIRFKRIPRLNENLRRCGEDLQQGQIALKKGEKLTALSLPLLASLGISHVKVYRRLKVAILSTGDELVPVGQPLQTGQIYDTNRFCIKLMLNKMGCEIIDCGILPDDPALFEQAFIQAQQQADLVITSGGVSVGEADFTKEVLEKLGKINFWKLAIKPGKPFAFGQLPQAWFCGLPGNPVSALVTFYQLVQPIIAKLTGHTQWQARPKLIANAATPLKKSAGRLDFQRGFYWLDEQSHLQVKPVGFQGSHIFSAFIASNCFIVLEQERGNVNAGEQVTIEPFDELLG